MLTSGVPIGDTPARNVPFVYVDDLDSPELSDDQLRHLYRSLRLGDGSLVVICDGKGKWTTARLSKRPQPLAQPRRCERARPLVTVGFAPPKGDRLDWAVQKLTEIGVDRIVLLEADHSVVRWTPDRARRRLSKLWKVVVAAGEQSRRPWLPSLEGPTLVDALASEEVEGGRVVLADLEGGLTPKSFFGGVSATTVLVGPEGGWSQAERSRLAHLERVAMADSVLRTETAAVAAGFLLVWSRGLMRA